MVVPSDVACLAFTGAVLTPPKISLPPVILDVFNYCHLISANVAVLMTGHIKRDVWNKTPCSAQAPQRMQKRLH